MLKNISIPFLLLVMVLVNASMTCLAEAYDDMTLVVEKIRADKKLFISTNMQLTEDEAKLFWPLYDRYQDELFLLRARTKKLIDDYARSYESMNNETAKILLDEFVEIERLEHELRSTFIPEFQKILPNIKVVRYFQIENKIKIALMNDIAAIVPLIEENE